MSRKRKYGKKEKEASDIYSRKKSALTKKGINIEDTWSRKDFINWYLNQDKRCKYCGCTENELKKFYELSESKRKRTRGKTLEIDRKEDKEYSKNNCVLACYYCNNAKSDVFTYDDFKKIGPCIGKVIKKRIK